MKRFIFLCCVLGGCVAAPVLDSANDASVERSVDAMLNTLPPEDRQELQRALVLKTFPATMKGKAGRYGPLKEWDGLTARQIIDQAKSPRSVKSQ